MIPRSLFFLASIALLAAIASGSEIGDYLRERGELGTGQQMIVDVTPEDGFQHPSDAMGMFVDPQFEQPAAWPGRMTPGPGLAAHDRLQ